MVITRTISNLDIMALTELQIELLRFEILFFLCVCVFFFFFAFFSKLCSCKILVLKTVVTQKISMGMLR